MINLNKLSLKQLRELQTADVHTISLAVGNVTAQQAGHGVVKVIKHDDRKDLLPLIEPVETHRGMVGNQREALRRSMKYLGLLSCANCATEFTDSGKPKNGKGRIYEDYRTGERWCYVCGTRS